MNETTNYGLKKPEQDDFYDIDDMNLNADTLDTELQKNAQATATAQTTADQALGAVGSINASTPEQVAAVGAKVDAVSSKVTAVDGKVVAVGTKVDTANTGITGVKSDIANLDGDVAAIGTKVGAVDSKVVAVDGKVTTVGTKVDTANTAITGVKTDVAGVNGKIGNSTDGETAATVFGKMLGMRNVVDWIKNTWTAAKATLLDVAVSTRAPASTALSTATWTSTRAGKLDNLDGKISEVGKSLSKKLVPSNNVKYEVKNLSFTLSASDSYNESCGVILNQMVPYSGIVRLKIITTSCPANTSLRYFNPYFTYALGSYGGSNGTILGTLIKMPVGTAVPYVSKGGTESMWASLITLPKNEFEVQAVKECPLLVFLKSADKSGSVSISSVQICYDEVTL